MKNIHRLLSVCCLVLTLSVAFQIAATSNQVHARIRRTRSSSTYVSPLSGPTKTTLSYNTRSHRFSLTVRPLQPGSRVNYTIAYMKKNSDVQEALQGARKITRTKTFSATLYAGTQSSKYFLPHTVTSGSLDVTGTDLTGSAYTFHENFTIQGRKLIVN